MTSTALLPRSRPVVGSVSLSANVEIEPIALDRPALFDTGVWTWVRDRRFPTLAVWFNEQVAADRVLICDLVVLELVRLAPNESQARAVTERLDAFESIELGSDLWRRARELQTLLAKNGDHRRVPPIDLLLTAAAEQADVTLVHYDRDYARIASVSDFRHRWFVPDGTLA